jgi:hypothetical protein
MTNEQFDALMTVVYGMIDARMAESLPPSDQMVYFKWLNAAEANARDLLVTDSPTEDQAQ